MNEKDLDNLIWILIKLGVYILTALGFFKIYLVVQGLRIYGIYNLFIKKDAILNHPVFAHLDDLYNKEDIFFLIEDPVRREIFRDMFRVELISLSDTILTFRDYIFPYGIKSFWKFIEYHKKTESKEIVAKFIRLIEQSHRDKLNRLFKKKLYNGGLEKEVTNYIIMKYYENTKESHFSIRQKLEILKDRVNMLFVIIDILDMALIQIEGRQIFYPSYVSKMNGKLDNISYKHYNIDK